MPVGKLNPDIVDGLEIICDIDVLLYWMENSGVATGITPKKMTMKKNG